MLLAGILRTRWLPNIFALSILRPEMINRHVRSPFWTPEQDALLQKLEAAGLPVDTIAKRLGATPTAVQRRSHHLRGSVRRVARPALLIMV
jgi:hypothetical protein